MNENKYTPEPWRAFNNGEGVVGVGTDHSDVCWTRIEEGGWLNSDRTIDTDYENARRIVACINACAGIDTELLEIIEDNDKTLAGVIANVEKQRDELMAENKQLRKDAERYRVLRDSKYQLDEDDPIVSDSFFNEYFGKELDSAVDELKSRFDSAIARVKGEQ